MPTELVQAMALYVLCGGLETILEAQKESLYRMVEQLGEEDKKQYFAFVFSQEKS